MDSRSTLKNILAAYKQTASLAHLTKDQCTTLYDVTRDEHEGFDGESVTVRDMLLYMIKRYNTAGLSPSRN